jgi:outer membrane lipoprotein SlyB
MRRLLVGALLLSISGCAHPGKSRYDAAVVGQPSVLQYGTVMSARDVEIQGRNTGTGAAIGAGGGAIAGSALGSGWGSVAGALGGLVVGGLAGAGTEQALAHHKGIEYTIAVENGPTVSIVQYRGKNDLPFEPGQRVVFQNGPGYQRVFPAAPAAAPRAETLTRYEDER